MKDDPEALALLTDLRALYEDTISMVLDVQGMKSEAQHLATAVSLVRQPAQVS